MLSSEPIPRVAFGALVPWGEPMPERNPELDARLLRYLDREERDPVRDLVRKLSEDLIAHTAAEAVRNEKIDAELRLMRQNIAAVDIKVEAVTKRVEDLEEEREEDTQTRMLSLEAQIKEQEAALEAAKAKHDSMRAKSIETKVEGTEKKMTAGVKYAIALVSFVFAAMLSIIGYLIRQMLGKP